MKKIIIRKTPVKKPVQRAQVVHHYHHYEKPKGSALKRLFWFTVVCGLIFAGVIKITKDSVDDTIRANRIYRDIFQQGMQRRQDEFYKNILERRPRDEAPVRHGRTSIYRTSI